MLDARGRGAHHTSMLPLAYFALAHVSLALALVILAVDPGLPGAFFYHARMIAVVHLLTIGWITGSILGAFYIVGPLALGMTMPVRARDWAGFAAFAVGGSGMVSHFWIGTYDGMAWSAALVLAAVANVAPRGCHGIPASVPRGVRLHIRLAFTNILAAGVLGIVIGIDKSRGVLGISPLSASYAHAHLAAIGWALMMIIGLSYRLMPMMLPARMPAGARTMASAVLLEAGLVLLIPSLIFSWPLLTAAYVLILSGLGVFAAVMIGTAMARLPRPLQLPRRDWSIWQVHGAFVWLLLAALLGVALARATEIRLPAYWVYGVAGLLGCIGQMVAGMHGRLLPFHAWFRATGGTTARPGRSAHSLISPALARWMFWSWNAGAFGLAAGLADARTIVVRVAALTLLSGVMAGAVHTLVMLRRARRAVGKVTDDPRSAGLGVPHTHHAH